MDPCIKGDCFKGLFARRSVVCVPLTSTNRRLRLARCRQHRDWNDNAKPQRGLLVDEFLESEDIRRMYWQARFQDLNPIHHGWQFQLAILLREASRK
ncbi:HTH_Tnp_Tc3_2 domain-containing protein [Trichonephila clavipes]|nr:HTH_Tnp_Tc3_2 domain-containing protein [Trichonephila clavipes]